MTSPSVRWVGALAMALGIATAATRESGAGVVVTFDDLPAFTTVQDGYGGINWNGEWTTLIQGGYPPKSPPNVIYNNAHNAHTDFNFVAPAVFDGAYVSGYPLSTITFLLFNNGVQVGSSASLSASQTPTFLSSGYSGLVDRVDVFDSGTASHYVLDDVTYHAQAVPEPASLALALAAAGLGAGRSWMRRRGRRVPASS